LFGDAATPATSCRLRPTQPGRSRSRRFPTPEEVAPVSTEALAEINASHQHSLAKLIDIGAPNQTTRVVLEQARQAAIAGIAKAALLPALTASAIGGYQRAAPPFPSNLDPQGFVIANIQSFDPCSQSAICCSISAGGKRRSVQRDSFPRRHSGTPKADLRRGEGIPLFARWGRCGASRRGTGTKRCKEVQSSAQTRDRRGLATIVTAELARRDTEQQRYTLAQGRSAQHEAKYRLLTAMVSAFGAAATDQITLDVRQHQPPGVGTGRSTDRRPNLEMLPA
jgi:outer membrane protein